MYCKKVWCCTCHGGCSIKPSTHGSVNKIHETYCWCSYECSDHSVQKRLKPEFRVNNTPEFRGNTVSITNTNRFMLCRKTGQKLNVKGSRAFIYVATWPLSATLHSSRLISQSSVVSAEVTKEGVDPCSSVIGGIGLRPLHCWDYGFESSWGHGCSLCR